MRQFSLDPNQEVEAWKDALYNDFKNTSESNLANYLDGEADKIIKKYNINCAFIKLIKEPDLVSAVR